MKHRYSKFLPGLTLLCDLLLMNSAYLLVFILMPQYSNAQLLNFIVPINLIWIFIAPFRRMYLTPRPLLLLYSIERFLEVVACHTTLVLLLMFAFKKQFSVPLLQSFFLSLTIFIIMVAIQRFVLSQVLNYIRRKGYNLRNIIIFGEKDSSETLKKHFSSHPEYGYDIIHDVFSKNHLSYTKDELKEVLLKHNPDEIFICYSNLDPELYEFFIKFGAEHAISIKIVSEILLRQNYARVINYDNLPVMQLRTQPSLSRRLVLSKRTFDVVFSTSVIVATSPLLAVLYVITKCTSKGPAWYKQERIGINGKPFEIIKFRSMYVDAEREGPQLATHGDPRVTPWGRIIRKTRLDELPQFWNVLKGEMSIVGPRPERSHFITQISERAPQYKLLQTIKPGITSIGQVSYGYAENVDQMCERMQYDLLYLQNISFSADLRLIASTVKVMVQGKGK